MSLGWLLGVCLLGAMTPGPSLIVILGVTAEQGPRSGWIAAWAHALGIGAWATLTLYGWQSFATQFPRALHLLSVGGAIYLLFLAWGAMRGSLNASSSPLVDSSSLEPEPQAGELIAQRRAALTGLMIALSNPKIMLFFIAIYTQVLPSNPSLIEQLYALMIPIGVDGLWYSLVISLVSWTGLLSILDRYQRFTLRITAALFITIAIQTLWRVLTHDLI